jgi:hypothetical protein
LGGGHYFYERNPFMQTEIHRVFSRGGNHGVVHTSHGNVPVADKDIVYSYDEASHVIEINDFGLSHKTLYRYDQENHRSHETFIREDGHIQQAVEMHWNAIGWLTEVKDARVQVKYHYDAKGNRRATIAAAYWDGKWEPIGEENWYTYNQAGDMLIDRGKLVDGTIKIESEKGTQLNYDAAGRRIEEVTKRDNGEEGKKTLTYKDNNLLNESQYSYYKESDNRVDFDFVSFKFDYDGRVTRRKSLSIADTKPPRSGEVFPHLKTINEKTNYNSNGWVTELHHEKTDGYYPSDNLKNHIEFHLNENGLPKGIKNVVEVHDDGYEDQLEVKYIQFETDKIAESGGKRHRFHGKTSDYKALQVEYDANGHETRIIGDVPDSERSFVTNAEGRIIIKRTAKGRLEHYFYTPDGQPLGHFGDIHQEGDTTRSRPSSINFDLNYHPVDEHFPPPTPSQCVMMPDETFADVAERVYGDRNLADELADANGYSVQDKPVGMTLDVPRLVSTNVHNWQGQYAPYNPAAIIGDLSPDLPMPPKFPPPPPPPQRRKRRNFWNEVLEVVVGTVVMAFAPELGVFLTPVLGGVLGEVLGFGLAGAVSGLASQETAVVLGDQEKISWKQVGQSAVLAMETAGVAHGLNIDLNASSGFVKDIQDGAKLTLGMQAVTFATGQQRHFDWRVTTAALANTVANASANYYFPKSNTSSFSTDFKSNTMRAGLAAAVDEAFMHTPHDSEQLAAQALGTVIGNQMAGQAKQYYADYQAEKQNEAAAKEQFIEDILVMRQKTASTGSTDINLNAVNITTASSFTGKTPTPRNNANDKTHANPTNINKHLEAEKLQKEARLSRAERWKKQNSQVGSWAEKYKKAGSMFLNAESQTSPTKDSSSRSANNLDSASEQLSPFMREVEAFNNTVETYVAPVAGGAMVAAGAVLFGPEILAASVPFGYASMSALGVPAEMMGMAETAIVGGVPAATAAIDKGVQYVEGVVAKVGIFTRKITGTEYIVPGTGFAARSLDDVAVRTKFYHPQLADIPKSVNNKLPFREKSLQTFVLRNEIKMRGRALMSNMRSLRKLPPPLTLKQITRIAYERNLVGDDLWKYIYEGSQRSNRIVDEKLNVINEFTPRKLSP